MGGKKIELHYQVRLLNHNPEGTQSQCSKIWDLWRSNRVDSIIMPGRSESRSLRWRPDPHSPNMAKQKKKSPYSQDSSSSLSHFPCTRSNYLPIDSGAPFYSFHSGGRRNGSEDLAIMSRLFEPGKSEWVAFLLLGDPPSRDWIQVSHIAKRVLVAEPQEIIMRQSSTRKWNKGPFLPRSIPRLLAVKRGSSSW